MNRDRRATLIAWQEAARIEHEALTDLQNRIGDVIAEADEYPRSAAITEAIQSVDRELLSLLISWQEEVQVDRDALTEARDALPDDGEDERFSILTREIANANEEILARAQEIETLAAQVSV